MVRLVPKGHWIVVLRSGRAVRIAESGLTVWIPCLERCVPLRRETLRLPLAVTGRSAEGVDVRLWGELALRVVDPARAAETSPDVLDVAADETERALVRLVSRTDLISLTDLPGHDHGHDDGHDDGHSRAAIEVPGVRLVDLRIDRIEIELTACVLAAVTAAAAQTK
ncbi:SPFH domain-containing protein [Kribbella sp. NPDC049174]|uniref:SPFH domain-containing protein n=1 Tax=Kribbella sp. NPDC049174 TaxID=3364112 RepID=UPI00371A2D96